MSYILDALERSEAERRRGEAPDLLMQPPTPPKEPSRWPAVLGAVVVVNLLGLGGLWWFVLQPDHAGAEPGTGGTAGTAGTATATATGQTQPTAPAARQPAAVAQSPTQHVSAVPAPVPAPVRSRPSARAADTTAVPDLDISSHIYSDHPDLRAVTIDGRRLQQGDSIRPGLRLLEITEDGVVVTQNGQQHRISVLPDWGL